MTSDDKYHSYSEIKNDFHELENQYSQIAKVISIGKTFEGRNILAIRIKGASDSKPKILLVGGIHAREWLGVETCRYIAKSLLTEYNNDKYIKFLVDNLEIWIVPVANPDGFEYDRKIGAGMGWRKNRAVVDYNDDSIADGIGVDLNRNFNFHWDPPKTASTNPRSDLYRGPHPASESEVQAIQRLLTDNFRVFVDFHSFSQLIIYPYGFTSSPTPNKSTFKKLANGMANRISNINGKSYTPGQIYYLPYPTSGDSVDFAYGKYKTNAFCIELPPRARGGGGFHPPSSYILPTARENYEAMKYLLDWAIGPPYVKSVKLIQNDYQNGNFTNIVYKGDWQALDGNTRKLKISVKNVVSTGKLKFELKFNKPMDTSNSPSVTFGRERPYSDNIVKKADGWVNSDYNNDTWIGEFEILEEDLISLNGLNTLSVSASDCAGNYLDADPSTIPYYQDRWIGYENANGQKENQGRGDKMHQFEIFGIRLF